MKVKRIVLAVIIIVIVLVLGSCSTVNLDKFVQVKDGDFVLSGEAYKIAGTNNYYLNYKDDEMIEALIKDASEMHVNVIRCWAFLDGFVDSNVNNNAFMQTEPGVYDRIPDGARNGFEALDFALKKAAEYDIKLVLVLVNNWDAFGGIPQYVNWSDTASVHDDFYTDETCKQIYKDYFSYLANRENTLTGVKYMNDPTIFSWELCNEPRCESDKTGDTLYNWIVEMSQYIKSIDHNHLVTAGDEGFFKNDGTDNWAYNGYSGVDWERNLQIDTIDYGTFHLYPEHWGDVFDNPAKDGSKWIVDHIKVADAIGKPSVLEEFGIQKFGQFNRDYIYETWLKAALENDINGTMYWILTSVDTGDSADENGMYPDFDGFRIMNDDSITSKLLKDYAAQIKGDDVVQQSHAYIVKPTDHEEVSGIYAVKVKSIENEAVRERYTLSIEGVDEKFDIPSSGTLVIDTTQYPQLSGEVKFSVEAAYSDGSESVAEIIAVVNNRDMIEVPHVLFDSNKDLGGFYSKGTYQAAYGSEGITQSNDLGGSMKIDTVFTGDYDWMELKICNDSIDDMELVTKIEYDLYFVESLLSGDGGTRNYLALDPGWIKIGQDENDTLVADMERVEIDGEMYIKQHMTNKILRPFNADSFYICIVGNMIKYEGPIYIDNVQLIKKEYAD